ncbi:MAG TPA: alpha/beta hydrolase [Candidatus Saccharimonadales bacterium]|nr:alpha/beta hydrolase [Candidatus Saccharimonadales bacterium]
MTKTKQNPTDYIVPLNMNGLQGRMLHVPAPKNRDREILLLYGHHALLERWWGLVQNLNEYGAVTMPDLPGFGGMDSFHKIGAQPTIDKFADYLASFIKMRYKRRRVTIIGISFGFVVATRMLQRYPELVGKVDLVVSMVGFMHKDDFLFSPAMRRLSRLSARVFATAPVATFIRYACLNPFVLKTIYSRLPAAKRRFIDMDPTEYGLMLDFEVRLWQANEVRTHWRTTSEFLNLDNCKTPINLPVWHVASRHDHYFNNTFVKEHMLVVFNSYEQAVMDTKAHTPSILADKKGLGVMVPRQLRKVLAASTRYMP